MIKVVKKQEIEDATKDTDFQIVTGKFAVLKKKRLSSTNSNDLTWKESYQYTVTIPIPNISKLLSINFTKYTLVSNGVAVDIFDELKDIEIEYTTQEEERNLKIKDILND